ncbi:MAG: aspartyl aminopeptidase [Halieaceae bacterium]
MDKESFNRGLLSFLGEATTPFHAVAAMATRLRSAGFAELGPEFEISDLGGGVFQRRGGSLLALVPGAVDLAHNGLRMVGAHTDSPCLMLKPQPDQTSNGYRQLGIEVYGGALLNPWFDRDLSLAGRVSYHTGDGRVATRLIDFRDPIGIIPSLAIHLDREANSNRSVNAQTDMAPLVALQREESMSLRKLLEKRLREEGADLQEVLDFELCFYDTQAAAMVGLEREFIASARLDNLLSCYTGLQALLATDGSQWCLLACNDHEEVGSRSASGAQGPMLRDFLQRLLPPSSPLAPLMGRSLMISADNAHGIHPNFPDKHDAQHGPLLNGGPVIKINASQRYATSSEGAGLFRVLASRVDVPVQSFSVRADMACGSTIGPIAAGELGVRTVDIGVPTFAMHSIRELAGSDDAWMLHRVLSAYYAHAGTLLADNESDNG